MITGFEITVHHPHTYVVKCIQLVRGEYTIFVHLWTLLCALSVLPGKGGWLCARLNLALQIQPSLLARCC